MAYTLAYLTSSVPGIPDPAGKSGRLVPAHARPPDRREHFGTEEAAMRRACELLPGSVWLDLRLYGPDGRLLATQDALAERLGLDNRGGPAAFEAAESPAKSEERTS